MYKDFDQKIKPEVIVLSDLNNLDYKNFKSLYFTRGMELRKEREYPNKSSEEIKSEVKEEIKKNIENYEKGIEEKFFQINKEKSKELEKKFKQMKLKINFKSEPKILRNGKFYTLSCRCFTLYDNRFFNILHKFYLENDFEITSAIQLDNQDLVFYSEKLLFIYRLKEGKYYLFQKIEESQTGYLPQNSHVGCTTFPKTYKTKFIKEISGNRFILVSNYGFKIYSLNEKNEYFISLLEEYYEDLKTIIELDNNSFIFCNEFYSSISNGGSDNTILIMDKIVLFEMTQKRKEDKLFIKDYYNPNERKKITDEKAIKVIESLKSVSGEKQLIRYSTRRGKHYFKGNAILKNKYFLIGIDNNILIFDIFYGNLLKRYELLINGFDNLYFCDANILKWNNNEDNEFLINIKGNNVLFELNNDNDLKVISQSYYGKINNLKILNEKNNIFYDEDENEEDLKNKNKKKRFLPIKNFYYKNNYCFSIFY